MPKPTLIKTADITKVELEVSRLLGYKEPPQHVCGMSGFCVGSGWLTDTCPACDEPTRFNLSAWEAKFGIAMNQRWGTDSVYAMRLMVAMLKDAQHLNFIYQSTGCTALWIDSTDIYIEGTPDLCILAAGLAWLKSLSYDKRLKLVV
jgi:hypothetical protein